MLFCGFLDAGDNGFTPQKKRKTVNKKIGSGIYKVGTQLSFQPTDSPLFAFAHDSAATEPQSDRSRLGQEVTAIFDRFRGPLLRYLSSFGLDYADSEEIVQEVFLSLFQHLARGKSRANLPGWIFRVAHNLALRQRIRSRQARDTRAESGSENVAVDPALNPEDRLAHNQTQQRLLAVVDALPELDRHCIFLRAEGLRYREIAGILDMSLGAVALSLAKSLARVARSAERCNP